LKLTILQAGVVRKAPYLQLPQKGQGYVS